MGLVFTLLVSYHKFDIPDARARHIIWLVVCHGWRLLRLTPREDGKDRLNRCRDNEYTIHNTRRSLTKIIARGASFLSTK